MSPNQLSGEDIHRTPPGDHRGCPRGFHPHTNLAGLSGCSLSMKPEVNTVRRKVKEERNILSVPQNRLGPASIPTACKGRSNAQDSNDGLSKSVSNAPRGVIRSDDNITVNGLPNTSFHVMLN